MNYALTSTFLILATMVVGCLLPWLSQFFAKNSRHAKHTQNVFLLGVGAMVGICFFDLLPEIFEMGGFKSLIIMTVVWAVYSIIHSVHFRNGHHQHHEHDDSRDDHHSSDKTSNAHKQHGFFLFMTSMIIHCFSSGVFLVISADLSVAMAKSVLFALVIHKLLEAFSVSAVITEHHTSRARRTFLFAAYLGSVPAGVVATLFFSQLITTKAALVLSDVAAGTLAGCLIYDFLIPNLKPKQTRPNNIAWMLAGLALMLAAQRVFRF
jgi:zinc transporter ZupT